MQKKRNIVFEQTEEEIWRTDFNVLHYFAHVADTLPKRLEDALLATAEVTNLTGCMNVQKS